MSFDDLKESMVDAFLGALSEEDRAVLESQAASAGMSLRQYAWEKVQEGWSELGQDKGLQKLAQDWHAIRQDEEEMTFVGVPVDEVRYQTLRNKGSQRTAPEEEEFQELAARFEQDDAPGR